MLDQLNQWLDASAILGATGSAHHGMALQCLGQVRVSGGEGDGGAEAGAALLSGVFELDQTSVLVCQTSAEVTLVTEESSERYVFWVPISGRISVADNQGIRKVARGRIGIVPTHARVRTTLGPDARYLAIVVPQPALLGAIETLVGAAVPGHVTFDDKSLSLDSALGGMIVRLLQLLEPISMDDGLRRHMSILIRRLESMMVLTIMSGLPHNFTQKAVDEGVGAPTVAPAVVSLAEAYMRENAAESISLADIALATGYSARTLQLAFRQFRQTTPMSVLRRIRLEHIHQELSHPQRGTTVAAVARVWQFSSTGRMASRFRLIYGETPQQVLRRGRRSTRP